MSTWYQPTIKYGQYVEGKHKIISEQYLFRCVSLTDLEATVIEALHSRIQDPEVDSFSKPRPADVYKMTDGPISEIEGDFYLVKILCDFGDSKTVDKHIVNADSPSQAEDRVRERLKNVLFDYEITHCDKTKILGIYDKDNVVWTNDFEKRMAELEAEGKTGSRRKKDPAQTEMNFNGHYKEEGPAFTMPDPTRVDVIAAEQALRKTTTPALRNVGLQSSDEVEILEVEDLDNGYETPAHEETQPVLQLPEGNEAADQPAAPSDDPTPPNGKAKKGKKGIIYHTSNEPIDG